MFGAYILHTFRHQDLRKCPLGKTFIFQVMKCLTLVWDHTCQESEAECSGSPQLPHALTVPSAQIFHKVLPHEKHHYRADGHKQQIPEMIRIVFKIHTSYFHSDVELVAVRTWAME